MRTRTLGTTGLSTSAIGLGCMGFSQGYGSADDAESVEAIHQAVESGVRMLDTAMSYGQGHNELLLRRAIADLSVPHDGVQVATKFGIVRGQAGVALDGRPENVRGYCDASLQRLGRDEIDLYYLHRVDPAVPVGETIAAMAELVAAGKVRHLGVSEVTPRQLEEATAAAPIAAVQFEWSLLWREPERELIPTARRLGVGLVPYSPLGRGLLTATLDPDTVSKSPFRASDPRFRDDALQSNLHQVGALRAVAESLGYTAGQLALAWLLAQGPDVVPIPGTRRIPRITENVAAAVIELSTEQLRRIDEAVPPTAWAGDRMSFAVPSTVRPTVLEESAP